MSSSEEEIRSEAYRQGFDDAWAAAREALHYAENTSLDWPQTKTIRACVRLVNAALRKRLKKVKGVK